MFLVSTHCTRLTTNRAGIRTTAQPLTFFKHVGTHMLEPCKFRVWFGQFRVQRIRHKPLPSGLYMGTPIDAHCHSCWRWALSCSLCSGVSKVYPPLPLEPSSSSSWCCSLICSSCSWCSMLPFPSPLPVFACPCCRRQGGGVLFVWEKPRKSPCLLLCGWSHHPFSQATAAKRYKRFPWVLPVPQKFPHQVELL